MTEAEYQSNMDTFEKRLLGDRAENILAKEHYGDNFGNPWFAFFLWCVFWLMSPFIILAYWGKCLWGKCAR